MGFRKFDNLWALPIFLLCCLILNNGVEATHRVYEHLQSVEAKEVQDLHRTGYHFQPPKHWINDPNGPMYYNGFYHLFYQYNPKGAVWGNIVWAHSISKDLINWEKLEPAILPSESFDQYGCWSGSATILPDKGPVILYSGIVDKSNTQVQNYAIPANFSDPYLQEWVKPDDNPLITADNNVNKTAFRDPTTAWKGKDGEWRITLGSRHKETGISLLYKSKDFLKWTKVETPLHSVNGTGNWECPDFFPISTKGSKEADTTVIDGDIKHVMKISLDRTRYDYYTLGKYDTEKDKYVPDEGMVDNAGGLRYDYGNFYASKSFFDPAKSRRILWGWANESDAVEDDVKKGWAGIQLIPRTIVLDPSGKQLLLWPIEELETLRGKKVELTDKKLEKGDRAEITGITAAQADVEVTFTFESLDMAEPFDSSWNRQDAQRVCKRLGTHGHGSHGGGLGPFGLITLATENLEELTPVSFRVFKDQDRHVVLLCSDARRSSLYNSTGTYRPPFAGFADVDLSDKKLTLRSLIDHSVVESFAEKGKVCITSRVYPTLATYDNAHLYVFNNGTETVKIESLEAWSMNNPKSMNH